MRARAALLYEPGAERGSTLQRDEHTETTQEDKKNDGDASMAAEALEEQMSISSLPGSNAPVDAAEATSSLISDAEMEDLFGPATAKSDLSMLPTPANGSSQQGTTEPAKVTESENQAPVPAASSTSITVDLNAQPQDNVDSRSQATALPIGDPPSHLSDPTGSILDFGSTDANVNLLNSTSALPDTNFDFSHMTTDDFNKLLASLGASAEGSGGQAESGTNLLPGLNLGKFASSIKSVAEY